MGLLKFFSIKQQWLVASGASTPFVRIGHIFVNPLGYDWVRPSPMHVRSWFIAQKKTTEMELCSHRKDPKSTKCQQIKALLGFIKFLRVVRRIFVYDQFKSKNIQHATNQNLKIVR